MTPKLSKRRDELAWKHRDEVFEVNPNGYLVAPGLNEPDTHFSEGFDACHAETLPMLTLMAEALREISTSGGNKCWQHQQMAADALATYHAWRGEDA
jgi:hypothetical protein